MGSHRDLTIQFFYDRISEVEDDVSSIIVKEISWCGS